MNSSTTYDVMNNQMSVRTMTTVSLLHFNYIGNMNIIHSCLRIVWHSECIDLRVTEPYRSPWSFPFSLSKAAVLNLFRLADHLTNFVLVRGPPKIFYIFLGKFLN